MYGDDAVSYFGIDSIHHQRQERPRVSFNESSACTNYSVYLFSVIMLIVFSFAEKILDSFGREW